MEVYYRVINDDLSVRQTEELVRQLQSEKIKDQSKSERRKKLNEDLNSWQTSEPYISAKVSFRINEAVREK
jgi:hypothetical protein